MEDYNLNPLNLMLSNNETSKNPLKQELSSKEGHHRTAKHSKYHTCSKKPLEKRKENAYASDESSQYIPIEERVLRKLKRERRLLQKWSVELNKAKNNLCNSNAGGFPSVDSNISEIEKHYHTLLPAIKLAMQNMEQATFSNTFSLKDVSSMSTPRQGDVNSNRDILNSSNEDVNTLALNERKRTKWLKECKERTLEYVNGSYQCISNINNNDADSRNSIITDISKQQSVRQARDQYTDSKKILANIKAMGTDDIKDPQSRREHCQSSKEISTRYVKKSRIQCCKPGADGEVMKEIGPKQMKPTLQVEDETKKYSVQHVTNVGQRIMRVKDATEKAPRQAFVSVKNKHASSRNFWQVEQNVLCYGPNESPSYSSRSVLNESPNDSSPTDLRSQASFWSNPSSNKVSEVPTKCECKDKKDSKPCICKCTCEEGSSTYDSKMMEQPALSSLPPSSGEEERFIRKNPIPEKPKNQEFAEVQTSFPSSIGPCKPDTCPKRRNKFVENRAIEMQTSDTGIERQYEPTMTDIKRNVVSAFKIPPKRTATMDDRLLRRTTYFDSHQTSVCNKNMQFCTYNVLQKKKCFGKKVTKVACSDCPGSRKCNLVTQVPHQLTCNEIVVEVKTLELNQEGVDSLMKVCSFLYVDYVFLGHVGNETNLAPVSSNVLFDSRKSYSVSIKFNRKERSILREQCKPSGLLAKDSVMFIVVCQAAPEFGVNKNWDFGYGYLSMKQVGEQMGSEDKISMNVEMQKIGGTKNNIGRLLVTIEGLRTVKSIMNEELTCSEPQPNALMKKMCLNKKELKAAESKTTRKKRIKKKK